MATDITVHGEVIRVTESYEYVVEKIKFALREKNPAVEFHIGREERTRVAIYVQHVTAVME